MSDGTDAAVAGVVNIKGEKVPTAVRLRERNRKKKHLTGNLYKPKAGQPYCFSFFLSLKTWSDGRPPHHTRVLWLEK